MRIALRRWVPVVVPFLVVSALAACGDSPSADKAGVAQVEADTTTPTTAPTPTTTQSVQELAEAQLAADLPLIKDLWRGQSDAWGDGVGPNIDRGFGFLAAHNYPALGTDPAQCRNHYLAGNEEVNTFREEIILDPTSVESDPDWRTDLGAIGAATPDGRVYIMTIETSWWLNDEHDTERSEVHVTIIDGEPRMFVDCGGAAA